MSMIRKYHNHKLQITERQKVQFIIFKLELKELVKPETASSTRSTLHLIRLNIFHFSALKSCLNIMSSDVMSNTPFQL